MVLDVLHLIIRVDNFLYVWYTYIVPGKEKENSRNKKGHDDDGICG
jgi:hypothetical protein